MKKSMKTLITCLVVFACICLPYTGRCEDWPNDPNYSGKGIARQDLTPYDIQYFFLSTMIPDIAPLAVDSEGAVGMSVDAAWRAFGIGREDVVIAYVEGGINWHYLMSLPELADKIYINAGELPLPCCAAGCGWPMCDNGDGWFNAPDYQDMMQARHPDGSWDHNGNKILDAEDLIAEFSDGMDNDGNGYIDDISGWDFYNDQNDPATYDTTYTHANSQMMQAAAITNNNYLGAGLCPRCMIMPVKAGAEALDRTDDLAQAWLFAADAGADIIVSTTADLGYSTFMAEAIDYITRRGVVIVESSNDFDSTDHQGGMFHAHVLPGNGLVPNLASVTGKLARLTTTFRERSSITSWGTHNMFSVPNHGGTTSESTPTVGGMLAMVKSGADDAFDQGLIDQPLSGFELVQVVRYTCSDISDPNLGWAGKPGWDLQYGYGRPNVYKAIKAVRDGEIPPVAVIDVPRWYFLVDPTRDRFLPVEGRMSGRGSVEYSWELQIGMGAEPEEGEFITVANGLKKGSFEGPLAMIDLEMLHYLYFPFFKQPFGISQTKALETAEQYTATLRLQVKYDNGVMGEERRSIFLHHDATWKQPFPKYIGPGGESQACLADLQGQGRLAIVFGDSDGFIHAVDSKSGQEMPGWPVHTLPTQTVKTYPRVNPRYEPIMSMVSVGDLNHDGNLWIVASSTSGRVYVFDAWGRTREGWPKTLDTGVRPPAMPRPALNFTRLPIQGSFAPPILVNLDRDPDLEIIQAACDGYLYIWKADGTDLLGWPKKVELPNNYPIKDGYVRINDRKIVTSPVIADLDGDGDWEIVVMTQYNDTPGADLQLFGKSHAMAYHHYGRTVSGWPAEVDAMAIYYGSAQEFITEGSSSPVACDVDGDGADEIVVSPLFSHPFVLDGDGTVINQYTGGAAPLKNVGGLIEALNALAGDYPMGFTTTGAFGTFDGGITYAQAGSGMRGILQMFLTPGQGVWLKNFERAFDAGSGTPRIGFPAFFQGLNFLGSPVIADVTGDGRCEIIDAGDSSALHAYQAGGGQAPGFPKFTTGWVIWSPSIGDLDADGRVEIVALTREGWLMVWETPGKSAANTEWWHYHHDEWNTGRYGTDTRPPGIARNMRVSAEAREIRFTAPGDDWYTGKPAHYMVSFEPGGVHKEIPAYASAGSDVLIEVPKGVSEVTIQAVDNAGNLGKTCTVAVSKATPEEETSGGNHGGGGICFLSTAMG